MIVELFIGTVLIILTVINHAFCFEFIMRLVSDKAEYWEKKYPRHGGTYLMVFTVLGIFFTHTIEAWIWALFYWLVVGMETLSNAIYFSTVTYTTLGYGDITLSKEWQLLSSLQAVDGILMFGWSTAFLVTVRSSFWSRRKLRNGSKRK